MVGAAQVELGKLSLAVGHGAGNTVRIEPHAAHAETRARAESANRHLQILRIVLAALHGNARHRDQRLGQVHLQLAAPQGVALHPIDGGRNVHAGFRNACRRHHDADQWCLIRRSGPARRSGRTRAHAPGNQTDRDSCPHHPPPLLSLCRIRRAVQVRPISAANEGLEQILAQSRLLCGALLLDLLRGQKVHLVVRMLIHRRLHPSEPRGSAPRRVNFLLPSHNAGSHGGSLWRDLSSDR